MGQADEITALTWKTSAKRWRSQAIRWRRKQRKRAERWRRKFYKLAEIVPDVLDKSGRARYALATDVARQDGLIGDMKHKLGLSYEHLCYLLDHVDYERGACGPTEMVAATLPKEILEAARKAKEEVQKSGNVS